MTKSPSRFLTKARIAFCGHILNAPWKSRLERRRKRGRVTARYVLEYLDFIFQTPLPSRCVQTGSATEERIFSIWLQGEDKAPAIVRACWRSIRENCSQKLVIPDGESIFDWIELPDYVVRQWKEGKMRHAHFTDICRLALLERYGGLWLDSTDFVSAPIPQWILDEDFFVFGSGDSLRGCYSFIQNCFIRARKGSYLLSAWLQAILRYWEREDSTIDYFVHQLIFKKLVECDAKARELYGKMPKVVQDPTHTVWFGNADKPYDPVLLRKLCSEAVFQKTEYKSSCARSPRPGSVAWKLMGMYPGRKRLFLFAAYDARKTVGESLLWYLKALSRLGDIVLASDNEFSQSEKDKMSPYVLESICQSHGEYDFGSYKRAFVWATEHLDLSRYDYVYLVNDSVFGPLYDLSPALCSMESSGRNAFALVENPSGHHPHLQSWFVGMKREIALGKDFKAFISSVQTVGSKLEVCQKYENGLTDVLKSICGSCFSLCKASGKKVYNSPDYLLDSGVPFVKKDTFVRHNGSLGYKLSRVFSSLEPSCREAILNDAGRILSPEYVSNLLKQSRFGSFRRYLSYLFRKAFSSSYLASPGKG